MKMLLKNLFLITKKHFLQIKKGGIFILLKKIKSFFLIILQSPLYVISVPLIFLIRIIRPWYLIRWHQLNSNRIGHFSKETELLYCEMKAGINVPVQRYLDIYYLSKYISNKQLEKMWRRKIIILPRWIMVPISRVNNLINIFIFDGNTHKIVKPNIRMSKDSNNLLERFKPSLNFDAEEEKKGEFFLRELGLSNKDKFVCLGIRDSAFLSSRNPEKDFSYHDYRDGKLEKFIMAAEELTKRGYYVIRMGAQVLEPLKTNNPKIIDYANTHRSDFMDIYLAAKCNFSVTTDYGLDEVMVIFRKPIVYIGVVPIGIMETHNENTIIIFKEHIDIKTKKKISVSDIFDRKLSVGLFSQTFTENGVFLEHNSSEQIRDAVVEMDERMRKVWKSTEEELILQKKFWANFSENRKKKYHSDFEKNSGSLHGVLKSKIGTKFLKQNQSLII